MLSAKTPEERHVAKATFQKSMKYLESDLKCRHTRFFKGNELPGMLDYMIWPWMERIDVLLMVFPELNPLLPSDQFPLMVIFLRRKNSSNWIDNKVSRVSRIFFMILQNSWIEAMKEDPAVKSYILDAATHHKFMKSYSEGNAIYDFWILAHKIAVKPSKPRKAVYLFPIIHDSQVLEAYFLKNFREYLKRLRL